MEIDRKLAEIKEVAKQVANERSICSMVKSIYVGCDYFSKSPEDLQLFVCLDKRLEGIDKVSLELELQTNHLPYEIKLFTEKEFEESYYMGMSSLIWSI